MRLPSEKVKTYLDSIIVTAQKIRQVAYKLEEVEIETQGIDQSLCQIENDLDDLLVAIGEG